MTATEQPLNILFVCTANQARSPLAEVIAKDQLARRGVTATVSSAGYRQGGAQAADGSQKVARKRGLDLTAHVSRQLTPELIEAADVIVGMEPGHVLDLADLVPGAQSRALTLKELAAFAQSQNAAAGAGPLPRLSSDDIRGWVRAAGTRPLQSLLSGDKTIVDPMGRSTRAFKATAKEIDRLLSIVFDSWFGSAVGAVGGAVGGSGR